MHFQITAKILGILLVVFSGTMIPPIAVALVFNEAHLVFLRAFGVTFTFGAILWLLFPRSEADMRTKKKVFNNRVLLYRSWLFGAIPFIDDKGLGLGTADGLFESFRDLLLLELPSYKG